ncbi:MAG: carboxypeptidase regulatory-like domain-containing protein, partial [Gemmatimonadota bacterium]|nr:carboxypeptidase regulatory-like domain-containing protein [Gemmatimonadota bacterium]
GRLLREKRASACEMDTPDADVLLSDHFLDTHCFRLGAADEDRPGMIGLEFEPVPGRNLPEIAGTLWVHPETAHLERLDYRYRNLNLPDALVGADPGGTVQFQGLPNGTWIVDSWRIRMPVAATGMTQLQGRIVTTLEGIVIMGGDVLRVHGTDGTVSEANLRGRIAGKVFDSLGVALPGARVFVEGTGIEIATRRDGGFELADFDPGVYSVNFAYPYMERYSYRPEPFKVEITEGHDTPVQINFAAPRISRILDNLCRDVEQPGQGAILPGGDELLHQGILVGQVFDPDGDPLPGARVRIVAIEYELSSAASQHVRTTRLGSAWAGVTFTTNARGYYLACWIPVDTYLQVAVLEPDQEPDPNTLQVAYTVSELIASREERVIIQAGAPYRTLDLRVEPK